MAKSEKFDYTTLGAGERLTLARDSLRAAESDHFRLSLTDPALEPTRDSRLPAMQERIEKLREVVAAIEKEAGV